MHIMEGFLPWYWCVFWYALSLPVIAYGVIQIKRVTDKNPESKPLLAVAGAFMFILSSLKLPSVTGSTSHPTGNGLGAVLFGPAAISVLGAIVLLFQALLLAHGGITTLGANDFSMGIVGPFSAWLVYKSSRKLGLSLSVGIFLAALMGDWLTYVTTATQLALAFPIPTFESAFLKFMVIYAYTQIPLAVTEGILTVVIFEYILKLRPDILETLKVIGHKTADKAANVTHRSNKKAIILLSLVLIIAIFPLILYNGQGEADGYFHGSDDQGSSAIEQTGYQPWFHSVWTPPSSEIESLLFAIQAAIGAVIIGYVFGYYSAQSKERKKKKKSNGSRLSTGRKMFENPLDSYAHSNGLKDTNTYFKVLFAISTMLVSLISTSPVIPLTVFGLMTFLIIFKAKIPFKSYLKFIAIPFIFAFMTFVFMALFFGTGAPILNLGIFNLTVTADGFNLGLLVFARIIGGFSCMAFLALTTPMTELFSVLEEIKIPKIVLELTMLMYRYIFVFLNEAINMYRSQETRMGYSGLRQSFKSMGMLISNLFIRTWIRGEQIYITMESRCYGGSIKTFQTPKNMGAKNILILLSFESFLLIGTYLTWGLKII